MKNSDIITEYFKKEKIGGIDIILHNSNQSKVFRKLLTKSIKYDIPYFKNIKKGKILRSNKEIITQCYSRKYNLIEEFSQKICLKTNGVKNTEKIESIIQNENKKLNLKLKDIDLVITILDKIYDDKKLSSYFMEKIKDRKRGGIEIDIVDIKQENKSSKKTPLFLNQEDIAENKMETEESTISIYSMDINSDEMVGGKRYNISYLAEYSNNVDSIMSKNE